MSLEREGREEQSLTNTRSGAPRGAILRISEGSYESCIVSRNTLGRVLAMDLEGFFSHAYLAFFKSDVDGEHVLSPRHTVLDIAVTPPGSGGVGALRAEAGFLRRALRLIRRAGVVAIQANDPYLSGFNAMLLSRFTGLPYVIEIVDAYDLSYQAGGNRTMSFLPSRAAEKRVERMVLKRAHAAYGDREFYRRYALENGARPARTHRVRCVTDPFYYGAAAERPLVAYLAEWGLDPSGKRVLFYAGGLRPCKNVMDLVPCLAQVRATGEDAILLVAGDGPLRGEMERRAAEMGVGQQIRFLGHRSAQELVDLMHGADVLLAPHAGYALIEMALSGTPVVAYDYEWHPELVRDGETGLLANYLDPAAMAGQAVRLLRDGELAARLGAAARRFALQNHDWPGALQDERRMYEQVLPEH